MRVEKTYDLLALGASGYTGQQLVRALKRQSQGRGLRIALAGRNPDKLEALESGFDVLSADARDAAALERLARQGRVLLNLAGPYAEIGESVVQACLAARCHHLDLSGEVFWMRQMVQRHHLAALKRGVLVVLACGYEALPFDVSTLAVAQHMLEVHEERCSQVEIAVRFTGKEITRLSDALSGGTLASVRTVLRFDHSDSSQRMDCLMPDPLPDGWDADDTAARNAAPLAPWWDASVGSVMAPHLPAPFINPPLVLRTVALNAEAFTPEFKFREGLQMRDSVEKLLGPLARALPAASLIQAGLAGTSRAAQWSAAATLAAPLAAISAATGAGGASGRSAMLGRQALQQLIELVGPKPGEGPSLEQLDGMGYELTVRALGEWGTPVTGHLLAQGHPGYRSTPEMMAAMGLALAEERLGADRAGVLSPGAAFGVEALPRLEAAGVQWSIT
jgi:short subunit dehydrogenase-like uncharacterized protein